MTQENLSGPEESNGVERGGRRSGDAGDGKIAPLKSLCKGRTDGSRVA